jgi:hypothetical protein
VAQALGADQAQQGGRLRLVVLVVRLCLLPQMMYSLMLTQTQEQEILQSPCQPRQGSVEI